LLPQFPPKPKAAKKAKPKAAKKAKPKAAKIRGVRLALDLSQKQAAELAAEEEYPLRIDGDAWSKLEREVREPTFENGRILLASLGIDICFQIDGEDATEWLEELLEED
jgi:hypothetical protein